ncbi:MAG TPA: folylpolyglutamate synthase/dihydrofolate synthase family protein [Thermoplasmata archaeon]|nr:folylpolyglutamate synthase/dihydrofolate synthase family protein [Thermoplasmata archaeon]
MDVQAALGQLYGLERFGIKLGLDNIRQLLALVGDPQAGLPAVHVTGTNGKGSVCAYVASTLRKAGYRTGLYTSPHLVRFNERIQVDGVPISDEDLLRLWQGIQPAMRAMDGGRAVNRPTFFEVTTALAFEYFRERTVDVAAIEVGMGGRFDATNVIDGRVAVIGRVGLEHTEHLGRTVDRIAREKAGIIKSTSRAVTVEQEALPVIQERCRDLGVPLLIVGREVSVERISQDLSGQRVRVRGPFGELVVGTPLLGSFQLENVGLAVTALTELRKSGFAVSDAAIAEGIATTEWPARLQTIRRDPLVLVDGAHNGPAAAALASAYAELFPGRKCILVIGILADKDLASIASSLGPLAERVIACHPKSHRAYHAEEVASAFRAFAPVEVVPAVAEAVDRGLAAARAEDIVLITGSIYTAGEALEHLGART